MPKNTLPDWELVLSSAARLQRILPDVVLVGGTASAVHAQHRFSQDADPILSDLRPRFDEVLALVESVMVNLPCSSYKFSSLIPCHLTWKKQAYPNARTLIQSGMTGKKLKQFAPTAPR